MSLTVALQMDPIESIDIEADSTFVLALEAQRRGYKLLYYHPFDLSLEEGRVFARVRPLTLRREKDNHATLGAAFIADLGTDADVILMRQDPPFDMGYITATHILEQIHPHTLVVNNPFHVRNAPEKILVTWFPDLMPKTLISRNYEAIKTFREKYGDIIIKPLYGNGGAGIFHIGPNDENFNALLEMFFQINREPVIAQVYMPMVKQGDKRIILIDGEPAGAINRIPAAGESRSNMHVGGKAVRCDITKKEEKICARIGPWLKERGLIFVGIDVIDGYLTEINVTSPTGIQEINRYNSTCLEALIWDAIERKL